MGEFSCLVKRIDDSTYWIITGVLRERTPRYITANSEKDMEERLLEVMREDLQVRQSKKIEEYEKELAENEAKAKGHEE